MISKGIPTGEPSPIGFRSFGDPDIVEGLEFRPVFPFSNSKLKDRPYPFRLRHGRPRTFCHGGAPGGAGKFGHTIRRANVSVMADAWLDRVSGAVEGLVASCPLRLVRLGSC